MFGRFNMKYPKKVLSVYPHWKLSIESALAPNCNRNIYSTYSEQDLNLSSHGSLVDFFSLFYETDLCKSPPQIALIWLMSFFALISGPFFTALALMQFSHNTQYVKKICITHLFQWGLQTDSGNINIYTHTHIALHIAFMNKSKCYMFYKCNIYLNFQHSKLP